MKSFIFFFVCFLPTSFQAREYVIRYQTLSAGSLFYVETKEGEIQGKVVRQKTQEGLFFYFLDTNETTLASGQVNFETSNLSLSILDQKNQNIGGFLAIIRNLYPIEYHIYNHTRQVIAKGYMNWVGSSFSLVDPENSKRYLTTFFRPFFKLFHDNWHFDIHEEGVIDFRLLSLLGAFQTACDLNLETLALQN